MAAGVEPELHCINKIPHFEAPFSLLTNKRWGEYLDYGIPLYKAALRGDWDAATQIHSVYPDCFTRRISRQGDTALHIAALARCTNFVIQLVALFVDTNSMDNLALRNNFGNTALWLAASSGDVTIASIMVRINNELPMIRGDEGMTPLHMAAILGHRDMVHYLLPLTRDDLSDEELIALFVSTINADLYDIALEILRGYPQLAVARDENGDTPLDALAKKSRSKRTLFGTWRRCCNIFNLYRGQDHDIALQQPNALILVRRVWEEAIKQPQDKISELTACPPHLLFGAVEMGNVEFVTTLISCYPDLIWKLDDNHRSIFHIAVQYRQEKIFRLIYEIGAIKDLLASYVDHTNGNSILHLAAFMPPPNRIDFIPGAALQMQREMKWFKVVKSIVNSKLAVAPNKNGETPEALFSEQHRELRQKAETWMRLRANSCGVLATLITRALFNAMAKVPGKPSAAILADPLAYSWWYWVYAISHSLALVASTTSLLMFLSILTSRYAQKDFLQSLPRKLMIGLSLLLVSISCMMIAFTATFHLEFKGGFAWVGVCVLAFVPVLLFGIQEFPLLLEVYLSTIESNYIFMPQNQLFRKH